LNSEMGWQNLPGSDAADQNREMLAEHGLRGSMGRGGVPYYNAKAESFMKTIKTEEVYLGDYETFTDVIQAVRTSSTRSTANAGSTQRSDIGALSSLRINTPTRLSIQHPNPCSLTIAL
jgi:transposase InsO family protein